jgi:mono/diheme cytochrome c family protein
VKRRVWLACLLLCAVLSAACDESQKAPAVSGATVFGHSCGNCHSLIGNESRRKQGGDLLGYKLTRAQLTSFTQVMPVHLSPAQLHAVVSFVLRAQARPRRGLESLKLRGG